ncbi:MAPEG family protein [Arenimonas daejeonensis]|uniref:MAPEG family protein n=1 Tax=Arenimonas daejeonensis TaxID=370777 RepID=UPI0011BFB98B|nr:MAPEG family protein [Arenimonas daejeonensis]
MTAASNQALLMPLLAMVCLTLLVWLRLYMVRIPEMRRSLIHPQQLAGSADKHLLKDTRASDNFINLFEVPVLFYVLVLGTMQVGLADDGFIGLAWAFVGLRVLHSLIQCSYNRVMHRFAVYSLATGVLLVYLARLAWLLAA